MLRVDNSQLQEQIGKSTEAPLYESANSCIRFNCCQFLSILSRKFALPFEHQQEELSNSETREAELAMELWQMHRA